ncbi:MAG TPA: ABC transporter permease subunit, partial [Euzebya sp.]|nr:ABC transporter permease subunit [Euzebya sp.]
DLTTGTEFTPVQGNFVSDAGEVLRPGWVAVTGMGNYTRAFTSPLIRGPFLRVFVWNYAFALGSVFLTFALGLALALALNESRMTSQRYYRSLLVIPYALPSFLTALVWAGLLNTEFGAVNQLIDTSVPWLTNPWWAKVSILLVNLWLGFPYMFLVCTGALQAIPADMMEAASVDGANARQKFSRITLPNLMITIAPLLIASFAFNFNNFNTVYLVTRGGPPIQGAQTPAGHTDILVSYVYRIAFESGRGADYGFAAAIAVLIFIMVAGISAYSFKYTRTFEEIA